MQAINAMKALLTLIALSASCTASAIPIDSTTNPTVLSFANDGLVFHFLPNLTGDLVADAVVGPDKRQTAPTPSGLRIIDRTLFNYAYTPGRANARFSGRVGFSGRFLRAGLERLGVRANKLRVLRYLRDTGRWQRVRALRRNFDAGPAGATNTPLNTPLVWAVTDQRSGLFAVAAAINIPEPETVALLGFGALLLVAVRSQRRLSI